MRSYPLIVKMEEVFLTPSHLAIVMEYVPGGNLNTMLCQEQKLSENVARWLFQQIILALEFMHRRVRSLTEMPFDIALGFYDAALLCS